MDWATLRAECGFSTSAFLATVSADGRPHVTPVSVAVDEASIWVGIFASSQKAKNLRSNPEVALHWPENRTRLIFIRARARFVDSPAERRMIWARKILPYDQNEYYESADDPELELVELVPYKGLVHRGDFLVPPEVWSPEPAVAEECPR